MDANLLRSIQMINQSILRINNRLDAIERRNTITREEADSIYAQSAQLQAEIQKVLVDTDQQDIS